MSLTWRILTGDVRETLKSLPDQSVQTVVTSPPYWGLRDYGAPGQFGLEPRPDLYVAAIVLVFAEVRRVLTSDGTVWLNLGDSYSQSEVRHRNKESDSSGLATSRGAWSRGVAQTGRRLDHGLKPKDLVGIPWRVAFALQADSWYLRSDIIWSKPNPMPESVTDRPTKAHEYFFLLSKSARYFYDADAIREGISETGIVAGADGDGQGSILGQDFGLQDTGSAYASVCVRLATSVLDIAQREHQFGLLSFDSQVGEQRTDGGTSLPVVHVPVIRRASAQASRFTDGDVSAKEFLKEMHRLCVALPDGDDLKEAWRLAALHVGHINADRNGPVAVNDASQISQIERIHTPNSTARVPSLHMKGTQRNDGERWRQVEGGVAARGTRNKRSVWHVATQPYPDAHFATYPEKLIEPCILAGSRPAGKRCDCDEIIHTPTGSGPIDDPTFEVGRAGFNRPRRPDEGTRPITRRDQRSHAEQMRVSPFRAEMATAAGEAFAHYIRTDASGARPLPSALLTAWLSKGWLRDAEQCRCPEMPADTVLDPFCGSGTTCAVAIRHGRNFIGCELNPAYVELAEKRIGAVAPLFAERTA